MRISIPPMFGEKWNDYVPTTHVGGAATAATKENLWGFDLARDNVMEFPEMDAQWFAFSRFLLLEVSQTSSIPFPDQLQILH
jgi:hypothetical protein